MEIEGTERLVKWLHSKGVNIRSITTDRSSAFAKLIKKLNKDLGTSILHFYDPWHLTKYLARTLKEAARSKECRIIGPWISKLKTHLWRSINAGSQTGSRENIRFLFNTCLYHVANIHEWDPDPRTGVFTSCHHAELSDADHGYISKDAVAYKVFENKILQKRFQEDIMQASPIGGTSICECKNSVDRIYCSKEIYFPVQTYPFYMMLSTMHTNELKMAEIKGVRKLEASYSAQRKYMDRRTMINRKIDVRHEWRKEIFDEYVRCRLENHNKEQVDDAGSAA